MPTCVHCSECCKCKSWPVVNYETAHALGLVKPQVTYANLNFWLYDSYTSVQDMLDESWLRWQNPDKYYWKYPVQFYYPVHDYGH